jgi:hypothetical protein
MSAQWDSLFDAAFDREQAEALHARFRATGSEQDLEACFNAFVPLVGIILKRKRVRRQDFGDAFSELSMGVWGRLQDPEVENISGYLNVYLSKAALNFMRTHPLYSKRLNPRPDGRPAPRRQISIPDAVHLEETVRRIPERIIQESIKSVRHGGVFRKAVVDAIKCYARDANPSPVLLDKKHGVGLIHAAKLCQVALSLVRMAKRKLREEVSGMQYYALTG